MKVFNAMFSKVNGGLEQVFLNYIPTLAMRGNHVIPIIHPKAEIKGQCPKENLVLVHNFNQHDPFAIRRLRKLICQEAPDCIITHSYRAAYLFKKTKTAVPKIAVCHVRGHYDFGADAIIAITESMRQEIIRAGHSPDTVFTVPNMINLPKHLQFVPRQLTDIPTIGACARFAANKGIDVLIKALAELKKRSVKFKARIAGDGKEWVNYVELVKRYQLENEVTLLGWVEDRASFYESIDIFCLPSREEAFGLVILESMQYGLPMVLSELPGPVEIIADSESALMVPPGDVIKLADALEKLIQNNALANQLASNAFQRVQHYSSEQVGMRLHEVLEEVCRSFLPQGY